MTNEKHKYVLELTERQARLLSWACDNFTRIIAGQDFIYQEFMERAWDKRCKEATGHIMDDKWDGGWYEMRRYAESVCKEIKEKFWGLSGQANFGLNYDEDGDIIWDIHQVIRHQLWLDNDDENKSKWTVDASPASQTGESPLAKIKKIED